MKSRTETNDRADRIAALSVIYPDLTVEQLEAVDADVQRQITAVLAEDYSGQRISSAADKQTQNFLHGEALDPAQEAYWDQCAAEDEAAKAERPDFDTRDREGK